MELDSWEALKEAEAAGTGFGIALEDEFIHDDRLTEMRIDDIDLSARQYIVCLPGFENLRPVQAFLDVVVFKSPSPGSAGRSVSTNTM